MQDNKIRDAIKPTQEDKEENDLFKITQVSLPEEQDSDLTDEELDKISGGVIPRVSPRMSCGGSSCSEDSKKH